MSCKINVDSKTSASEITPLNMVCFTMYLAHRSSDPDRELVIMRTSPRYHLKIPECSNAFALFDSDGVMRSLCERDIRNHFVIVRELRTGENVVISNGGVS